MSLHAVRNKLKKYWTRDKVFDSLFLTFLCVVYFIVALFHLGDMVAPQTFYRAHSDDEFYVLLKEPVRAPRFIIYTGITENDFTYTYNAGDTDIKIDFDGPFKWHSFNTIGEVSAIKFKNTSGRNIDFGEIAIMNQDNERIDFSVTHYNPGRFIETEDDYKVLTDEQELVQKNSTAMNSTYFDEIYFAQTAYQYATGQKGYEDVHPPLGKIIQSIPIALTGKMTPFTWRIMGTITGVFIIIATYFLAKEIFTKASFARVAAILVALSGLHFVQTRVGTVDSYLCLFTILAFLFMMKFVNSKEKMQYFILSGIFFGCACSVKWSGAFGGIGLALLLFAKLRKNIFKKGNRKWLLRGIFAFILIPLTIYCSSYLLFQNTTRAKNLGDVYNQGYRLFSYHSNEITPHPYSSKWFTWPILLKPMLYVYDSTDNTSIYLMGNYVIALVSVLALILSAYYAFRYKDRRSLIIVVSWLGLFLPYAFIRRTMFLYHYLPASIFAILAVVNLFYLLPGIRKILPAYLLAALISFIISFPKLAGI